MAKNHKQAGFTIVELLIVIVVIGILAAITIVAYNGIQARTHNTVVQSELKSFGTKLEHYFIDNDRSPASVADLNSIGFPFASSSYQAIVYCKDDQGNFGISGRSAAGNGFYYTHAKGTISTGTIGGTGAATCSVMGMTSNVYYAWGSIANKTW